MKQRFFVMILLGVTLLSGCGGNKGDYQSSSAYDASYATEDNSELSYLDDETDTMEAETQEPVEDEGTWTDEQFEDEEGAGYVEPEGIIAALVESDLNHAESRIQVIAIDPDTGEQGIVSEFSLRHATSSEIMSPNDADESAMRYMLKEYYSQSMKSGNHREWFSDDYTKMVTNRVFVTREFEQHAGWVDTDGNFFDVTEAVGLAPERGFSNSAPVKHIADGFNSSNFIFHALTSAEEDIYYSVPMDNATKDTIAVLDHRYGYYETLQHGARNAYPTCWINEQECLVDYYESSTAKSKSMLANVETGELTEYLPETDRITWNGVINHEKNTVALATVGSDARDGNAELYIASLDGGEPEKLTLIPNSELLFSIADATKRMLFEGAMSNDGTEYGLFLLEWR